MAVQLFVGICAECGILTDDRNITELPVDKCEARANLHDLATGHTVVVVEVVDVVHIPFPAADRPRTAKPYGHVRDRFTPDHHTAAVGGNV